jgi:type IV pilus modification protein PilV
VISKDTAKDTAMKAMTKDKSKSQRGFTLIEVLVALFVLAIGLLGLAMLQTTGLRFNTNSYSRTQATLLAYDIMDRMRANVAGFKAGSYDVADGSAYSTKWSAYSTCKATSCNCDVNTCDATSLALYDLGRWYAKQYDPTNTTNAPLLLGAAALYGAATPNGATITRPDATNPGIVRVTMMWDETNSSGSTETKSQSWQAEIVQ